MPVVECQGILLRAPRTDFTPILVGGAIGLVGYLYGLIDARASAERMSERNGLEIAGLDVKPAVGVDASSGTAVLRRPFPRGSCCLSSPRRAARPTCASIARTRRGGISRPPRSRVRGDSVHFADS
jgi:hypothetical protein